MPIRSLQLRLTQVGVIRLGEKRTNNNGKTTFPAKLETFRLTSPSRQLIEKVAKLYGGDVREWPDGPSGPEFQVITKTREIPVYVLPQRIDPNLELWGNRHRVRLCDGEMERIRNKPCLCEAAARVRYQRAGMDWPVDGRFARDPRSDCKPTTRISVMVADVSDGQWKIESHGWNAAAELPTTATFYLAMAQKPVPATLRMDLRDEPKLVINPDGSEKVDARKFAVPVLDFGDLFTARQALTGGVDAAVDRALEGQRLAISAGPADPLESLWSAARAATTSDELRVVWNQTDDAELRGFIAKRKAEMESTPATGGQGAAPATTVTKPIEGEVEPDPNEVWAAILREAGKAGWNTAGVKERYAARMGHDPDDADGWQLTTFLDAMKSGQVQ